MTDQTSELLYMRAKLRLPGGVNSPVRAYQAVGRTPRFIQSAKVPILPMWMEMK
mgnify:CR=1 FL=1